MPSTVATYQQGAPAQRVIAVAISSNGTLLPCGPLRLICPLMKEQETNDWDLAGHELDPYVRRRSPSSFSNSQDS